MAIYFWSLVFLIIIIQVDANITATHQTCPSQSEAMAFVKLVEDFVYYRKIDDLIIFDFFDVVKNCTLMNYLFMRLHGLLNECIVKTQICSDPRLMPFDSPKRTGIVVIFPDYDDEMFSQFFLHWNNNLTNFQPNYLWMFIMEDQTTHNVLKYLTTSRMTLTTDFILATYRKDALRIFISDGKYSIDYFVSNILESSRVKELIRNMRKVRIPSIKRGKLMTKTVTTVSFDKKEVGLQVMFDQRLSLQNSMFDIQQVYKIRPEAEGTLVLIRLGFQNIFELLAYEPLTIEKRHDFYQNRFTVAVYSGIDELESDKLFTSEVVDIFKNILNANIEIIKFDDEKQLKKINDPSERLIASVKQARADLGIQVSKVLRIERLSSNLTLTLPIINSMHNFYLRRPITKVVRDIYLHSFSYPVLATLAAMVVFIGFTLKVTFKYSERNDIKISDLFIIVASIFSMQGAPMLPRTFIPSTALLISLFFSLISYNVFFASTTSKLSIQVQEIFTPEDLLYNSNFEVGFTFDDEEMLQRSKDPVLIEVYNRAMSARKDLVMKPDEGLRKALKTNYAIFGDRRVFRRAIKRLPQADICNIIELKAPSTYRKVEMLIPRNSPYEKLLNYYFLKMNEDGVGEYLQKIYENQIQKCEELDNFEAATVWDIRTAFKLLLLAFTIGTVICFSEAIIYKIKKFQVEKRKRKYKE